MEWFLQYDYIFYAISILIACFLTPDYSLLLKIITLDSLYNAYHFFKTYFQPELSESQIVRYSGTLYNSSLLDRYIIYFGKYIAYKIICYLLWVSNISGLYYLTLVSCVPPIVNKIVNLQFFDKIREYKEKVIKVIIAKQFASLIKLFSKIYLNKDTNVKHKELLPLLNSYKNTIHYFQEILKNGLIMLLVTYIKNYSSSFYYKLTKYLYNYKTGDMLVSFNIESAKGLLNDIIDHRSWHELQKPNVYRAIFHLYQTNEEKSDFFSKLLLTFNFKLLKMFTIWSVSSFLNNILVAPIISLFFTGYRHWGNFTKNNLYDSLVVLSSVVVGYYTDSFLLTSIICQFGYVVVVNNITYCTSKFMYKQLIKKIKYMRAKNYEYEGPMISSSVHILMFSYVLSIETMVFLALHIGYVMLTNNSLVSGIFFGVMMGLGSLSNFNIFHILCCAIIIYVGLAFIDDQMVASFLSLMTNIKTNIKETNYTKHWNTTISFVKRIRKKVSRKNFVTDVKNFDIMDIHKYPSASFVDGVNIHPVVQSDKIDENPINKQKVIRVFGDDNINHDIFELIEDNFIDAICVNQLEQSTTSITSIATVVSSTKHVYNLKKSSTGEVDIVDNFLT